MLQELGRMSRGGHKTGTITTYNHTWLLKTDGRGCIWISDPIPYHTEGSDSRASVTEVRHRTAKPVSGKHRNWYLASDDAQPGGCWCHISGFASLWVCHACMLSLCPALWLIFPLTPQVLLYSALVNISDAS